MGEEEVANDLVAPSAERGRNHGVLRRGLGVVASGVRVEPWVFGVSALGATAYGVGTAGGGWVLGRVTDRVLTPAFAAGEVTSGQLWAAGLALAGVALLTATGVVTRRVAAGITMFRLQARYRRAVTRQYLRLPLAWHQAHPTGQLLSNANADVEAIWQVMAPLPMAFGVVVMLVVAVVAMFLADPVLGAVGVVVLPAIVLVNAFYQRRMSPAVVRAQQLRGSVSAVAHESFEAAVVVKTLGRETEETERFAREAFTLRDAAVRVGTLRGLFDPVIEAIPALGTLAVLAVGALRVSSGAAQTGDVVQVAYLLTLLAFPVRAIGWVLGELPRTVVGYDRVDAVLSATGRTDFGSGGLPGTAPVELGLRDVGYTHPAPVDAGPEEFMAPALRDVTLDVAPGRTVAVVGRTGSGKTTLATLLVRLRDPSTGRVLVDGTDLRELAAGVLPQAAALVSQSTFVFQDTVRENVTLGDPELDDTRVWEALRAVHADGFVERLPGGLDSVVGEGGATLSGGQRQRLALARAVVRRPRLMVLDDATSAVDPRIEAAVLASLRERAGGTTLVLIAYRRATIALADEVVHVHDGRIVDRGRHEDLVARDEGYRRIVEAYDHRDEDLLDEELGLRASS